MAQQPSYMILVTAAAGSLKARIDEVNRLNVFPVPDGDTGTNMSLTMDAVLQALAALPDDSTVADVCHAITQGSLMGARGNSGVILSQMLRGLCEAAKDAEVFDPALVAAALARATEVSFQAVRKPVEGTMLTVLKDTSSYATTAVAEELPLDELLPGALDAARESVRRTPDLLPVLKENGVVDAGAYGLAILAEGLLAAYEGREVDHVDVQASIDGGSRVEPVDDWDDDEYLYCTEFLLHADDVDVDVVQEYISSQGGSELVVGGGGTIKIHVHTNDPGPVLAHMTTLGEVDQVHINNMRRQTADRSAALSEDGSRQADAAPTKPIGLVSVATGDGVMRILESLGVDAVVSGGQTMNPSTAELLDAATGIAAQSVLFLPNNKNIILAAQQAADHMDTPALVVPTKTVPEAFSALLAFDPDVELDANAEAMADAASGVRTGEVTTAIKDSKSSAGDVAEGQIIGIADHEIRVVGNDVVTVAVQLFEHMKDGCEIVTILAGADLDDADTAALERGIATVAPEVDIEIHRGEQPLYPVILSVE